MMLVVPQGSPPQATMALDDVARRSAAGPMPEEAYQEAVFTALRITAMACPWVNASLVDFHAGGAGTSAARESSAELEHRQWEGWAAPGHSVRYRCVTWNGRCLPLAPPR